MEDAYPGEREARVACLGAYLAGPCPAAFLAASRVAFPGAYLAAASPVGKAYQAGRTCPGVAYLGAYPGAFLKNFYLIFAQIESPKWVNKKSGYFLNDFERFK